MNQCMTATKLVRMACGLGLISLLSGCLDADTLVYIKKDGSGTVTETVLIRNEFPAWTGADKTRTTLAGETNRCRNRTLAMGNNVRLESVAEVRENGMSGFRTVYSFTDVRRLSLDPQPDLAILGNLVPKQVATQRPVTFAFDNSSFASLVVNLPKPPVAEAALPQPIAGQVPRDIAAQQRAVVRKMFTGFRVQLRVRIQGVITGTTASHVEPGNGNTVVLFDFNIGKLTEEDHHLDKLLAMGRIEDVDTARVRLSGMSGISIESAESIELGFR